MIDEAGTILLISQMLSITYLEDIKDIAKVQIHGNMHGDGYITFELKDVGCEITCEDLYDQMLCILRNSIGDFEKDIPINIDELE